MKKAVTCLIVALLCIAVAAVVLLYGFRIKSIDVSGNSRYSGEQIRDVRRSREADGVKQLQHLHGREQLESGGAGPEELRVLSDLRRDVPQDHRPPQILAGRHHPGNEKLLRPVEAGVGRISPPAAAPVLPEASPVTV